VDDNRRYPRYPTSLPVRLWLTEHRFLFGRTVDVSLHGIRLERSKLAPADVVVLGGWYRVAVMLASRVEVRFDAVIRYRDDEALGAETLDALPVARFLEQSRPTTL
jgi:PilZ domain-containing protein